MKERAHFGRWLRSRIAESGQEIKQFAARVNISENRLHGWLVSEAPNLREASRGRLAKGLGVTPQLINLVLLAARNGDSQAGLERAWEEGYAAATAVRREVESDARRNLGEPLGHYAPIPYYDRDLAAGPWTEALGLGDDPPISAATAAQGLFRVRLRGDSMTPTYGDGEVVEFRLMPRDRWGEVAVGGDYYVQCEDDCATFKRATALTASRLTLTAINRRTYPHPLSIEWARVVRVAVAVAVVRLVPPPRRHNAG